MNDQDFTPLVSNGSILYPLMNHFSKCFYTILLHKLNHNSMTQLLSHTFTHLTGPSFRLKAKLLPNKNLLGLM